MGWFALGDGGEAGGEAVRPAMVVDCLKHVCLREVLDITVHPVKLGARLMLVKTGRCPYGRRGHGGMFDHV